ncbi:hypothetical protein [Streptomyces sp. NPDC020965]|uniref:hypothetical protein n=1 Tax=Streptomyces sp. NPDC020965 TaxID=3365105 RepID=UPI0037A1E276
MTERERAAAQAYVRLLRTTRAVLGDTGTPLPALPLLAAPIAEADAALAALGMAGNEEAFFRLVARGRQVSDGLGA